MNACPQLFLNVGRGLAMNAKDRGPQEQGVAHRAFQKDDAVYHARASDEPLDVDRSDRLRRSSVPDDESERIRRRLAMTFVRLTGRRPLRGSVRTADNIPAGISEDL